MKADRFVTLRSGATLPLEGLLLAWGLERRGFRFEADTEDLFLRDCPFDDLTKAEREALRHWREDIMLLVNDAGASVVA